MALTDLSISMGMALTNSSISMGSTTEDGTHWFVNFHGVNYWKWHAPTHLLRMAVTDLSISIGSTTETGTHWFVNFHGVNVSQTGSSSHSVLQHTRWRHHVSCEVERADPAHHFIKNIIWLKREISSTHSIYITHDLLPASQEWLENERCLFSTADLSEPF